MSNTLKKYLTTDRGTRIQTLRLTDAWQAGLAHQDLPSLVVRLLGELSAASVLLAGNIKFDGSVVLQLQGNGPVRLIMVECTSALELRATAHLREEAALPETATLQDLMNQDGQGRFTVMLDPGARQKNAAPYQGIVPLDGDTVADALEYYMKHSEQLDTRLWLAADSQQCAGLLLQRMPAAPNASTDGTESTRTPSDNDSWTHCVTLAGTLKTEELLRQPSATVMHKLFWNDDLLAFPEETVTWHCPCSRERVAGMLQSLGKTEVDDILAEQGRVHIDCNFCGKPYDFDAVDCAALFAGTPDQVHTPGSDTLH